jgi:hypothetical protein
MHLTVRRLADPPAIAIESDSGVLTDDQAGRADRALTESGLHSRPILTYLANKMRIGDREIPYSLVSAVPLEQAGLLEPSPTSGRDDKRAESPAAPSIVLNTWAAEDLQARRGDRVTLEYFVWKEPGRLETESSTFQVRDIVPIAAGDRDMAPPFPGVTNSPSTVRLGSAVSGGAQARSPEGRGLLARVQNHTQSVHPTGRGSTPLAFAVRRVDVGARRGRRRSTATSLRPHRARWTKCARRSNSVCARPSIRSPWVWPSRTCAATCVSASSGATDFGEYFTYFSFFLVVSALVLALLFFKLGVEQRVREVGLLRALGFTPRDVRRLFLTEGVALGVLGGGAGAVGAVAYAALLMYGLRTWWFDAVGTTSLSLHVTSTSLGIGALAGIVAAIVCIWWTLRGFGRVSERTLLSGQLDSDEADARPRRSRILTASGAALVVLALALLTAAATVVHRPRWRLFWSRHGAAGRSTVPVCCRPAPTRTRGPRRRWLASAVASRRSQRHVPPWPQRDGRRRDRRRDVSLISVDAFRRGTATRLDDPHSGTGGASLLIETLTPVVHDPNSTAGRESMNLFDLEGAVTFSPFRLRPGDDASCLNLYAPKDPRILAPTDAFVRRGTLHLSKFAGSH